MAAYEQGTICATPIINGPFDPFGGGDNAEHTASSVIFPAFSGDLILTVNGILRMGPSAEVYILLRY